MASKKNQRGLEAIKPRNPFHDHPALRKGQHTKGRSKQEERRLIQESMSQLNRVEE